MKHMKMILAGILALALTACADTSTAEDNSLLSETTSEAVSNLETTLISETEETTLLSETKSESITEETEAVTEETTVTSAVTTVEDLNNNEEIKKEIREALEKVSDAYAFKEANFMQFSDGSKYSANYVLDKSIELSGNFYSELNPEIAKNEDELFNYLRGCFTKNFISDDDLRKGLFSDDNGQPSYITKDGVLYMNNDYHGVPIRLYNYYNFDGMEEGFDYGIKEITEYSENSAKVSTVCTKTDYAERYIVYLTLKKSPEYGWQLDAFNEKDYFLAEQGAYDPITEKTDKLNLILGGGNTPANAAEITVNGSDYTQTDLDMSIDEMHGLFGETFISEKLMENMQERNEYDVKEVADIYTIYSEKYIDSVYIEQDGILYRKNNAPKYYLPQINFDPYKSSEYNSLYYEYSSPKQQQETSIPYPQQVIGCGNYTSSEQTFTDADGKSFSSNVSVFFTYKDGEYGEAVCTGSYVASELPIKEIG